MDQFEEDTLEIVIASDRRPAGTLAASLATRFEAVDFASVRSSCLAISCRKAEEPLRLRNDRNRFVLGQKWTYFMP